MSSMFRTVVACDFVLERRRGSLGLHVLEFLDLFAGPAASDEYCWPAAAQRQSAVTNAPVCTTTSGDVMPEKIPSTVQRVGTFWE